MCNCYCCLLKMSRSLDENLRQTTQMRMRIRSCRFGPVVIFVSFGLRWDETETVECFTHCSHLRWTGTLCTVGCSGECRVCRSWLRSDDFDHREVLVSGEVEFRQCLKMHKTHQVIIIISSSRPIIGNGEIHRWSEECVRYVTLVSFLCPPARSFMTTMLGLATFSIRFTC